MKHAMIKAGGKNSFHVLKKDRNKTFWLIHPQFAWPNDKLWKKKKIKQVVINWMRLYQWNKDCAWGAKT